MKAFFKLLHNESAVSLAVHRVGNSLVLEALELDDADASTSAGSRASTPTAAAPLQLARKSIHDNFRRTLGADGGGGGRAAPATLDLGDGDAADGDDDSDDDEREEWMPPRRPPRGFRRVLRWQLDDLSLLLGSDTVVYRSEHAQGRSSLDTSRSSDGYHSPGFSVKLHDENSSATSLVCLDYWLDNVMSNASDVALCLQKDGVVQGRVVPTEQLPAAGGLGDGFSPAAVTDLRRLRPPLPAPALHARGGHVLARAPRGRAEPLALRHLRVGPDVGGGRRRRHRRHGRRRRRAGGGARGGARSRAGGGGARTRADRARRRAAAAPRPPARAAATTRSRCRSRCCAGGSPSSSPRRTRRRAAAASSSRAWRCSSASRAAAARSRCRWPPPRTRASPTAGRTRRTLLPLPALPTLPGGAAAALRRGRRGDRRAAGGGARCSAASRRCAR